MEHPRPPRVMLIEDDSDINMVLSMALRSRQYDVLEFADGQSALDALAEFVPDIVIVDAGLPGISGIETGRMILQRTTDRRVVMVLFTGSDTEQVRAAAEGVAFDLFVSKPVSIRDLCDQLTILSEQPNPNEPENGK